MHNTHKSFMAHICHSPNHTLYSSFLFIKHSIVICLVQMRFLLIIPSMQLECTTSHTATTPPTTTYWYLHRVPGKRHMWLFGHVTGRYPNFLNILQHLDDIPLILNKLTT